MLLETSSSANFLSLFIQLLEKSIKYKSKLLEEHETKL